MLKNKKISLIICVMLAFSICLTGCGSKTASTSVKPKDKSANNFITASGTLEAENEYTVSTTVMADILSDNFKEGDVVKAGQLLYSLKQTDIQNSISQASLAVQQAQLAYNLNSDNISKLSVKSGFNGTVTNVYVSKGDMLPANAKIADVVDDSKMKLSVPFVSDIANNIYVGQAVTVSIVGTFYTASGSVSNISSGELTMNGSKVKMIDVTVTNPGTLKKGDKGTATINGVACNDAGEFDYTSSGTIIAEVPGKVSQKNIEVGDKVYVGKVVANLESDALVSQQQQNALSIKNAKLSLDNLTSKLDNYNIKAKMNGTVIKKNVDKNDTLSQANIGNMAVIADLSKIIVKVNVDELDVPKIKVGKAVTLTADADPNKEYQGTVELVGESGTLVNGVALYEIKIVVTNPETLMPGMNVTAKFDLK